MIRNHVRKIFPIYYFLDYLIMCFNNSLLIYCASIICFRNSFSIGYQFYFNMMLLTPVCNNTSLSNKCFHLSFSNLIYDVYIIFVLFLFVSLVNLFCPFVPLFAESPCMLCRVLKYFCA